MNTSSTIGAKTLKLSDLISLGLNVPKFKAVNANEIKKNINNFEPIAKKIHQELNCEKYAVRSSALIEDSQQKSFAGQFKTKINIDETHLAEAMQEITDHAQKFLHGSIEKFSILIQEYIEADISGVTFTRSPTGGREMVIEYHTGRGEDLVSGKIKPAHLKTYWPHPSNKTKLPKLNQNIRNFKKIENFYKFPQDIEWCIKNNKWYFLQTRPITTISKIEYQQSLYLDRTLPNEDFYYEKTEISEIAPRPTQITKDILKKLYQKNGPIQQIYKKFRINYSPTNILKIIGNELFIDREEELKTLLPSYSYLTSKDLNPKLTKFSGIFTTIKNFFFLYRINLNNYEKIFQDLKTALENEQKINTVEELLNIFKQDYQIVFEINLLAGISIKKIENLIKNDISLSIVLSQGEQLITGSEILRFNIDTKKLTGNTIEISDESTFTINIPFQHENSEIKEWWGKLSEVKKRMLKQKIEHVIIYNKLREISRWLVVKRINQLRKILFKIAEKNNFHDKTKIYFATLEEIINRQFSQDLCENRKHQYQKYADFNMPKILTNKIITKKQQIQGVSPGKADGILVEANEINNEKYKDKNKILFTRILSPELVKYFDQIKGIVSEQGGFLSHLAIIARERQIPVITGVSIEKIERNKEIKIDGSSGKISNSQNFHFIAS